MLAVFDLYYIYFSVQIVEELILIEISDLNLVNHCKLLLNIPLFYVIILISQAAKELRMTLAQIFSVRFYRQCHNNLLQANQQIVHRRFMQVVMKHFLKVKQKLFEMFSKKFKQPKPFGLIYHYIVIARFVNSGFI